MTPASNGELPSATRRAAIAAVLKAGIEGSFAHWEAVPELDFAAAFERCVAEMMAAPDRLAFGLAIQRLMAALGNGHTGFHDGWWAEGPGRSFGLMLRPFGERWTVTRSLRPELPVGTEVVGIDGAPMAEVLAQRRVLLCASNDRAAANLLFYRRHLFPDRIVALTAAGADIVVEKGGEGLPGPALPALRYERDVAILSIGSFDADAHEAGAVAAIETLKRDESLVIDLRGNGGGNTPLELLAALMDRPYRRWRSSVLQWTTLGRAWGEPPETITYPAPEHAPVPDAHRGRLALLIDGMTGSAAEDFAMPFRDSGRAVLVGETTGGSSGQPHRLDLGDRMFAWIGAKRESFPDGAQFEGVGIAPDIAVETTPEDLGAGRDPVLAAALDAIA